MTATLYERLGGEAALMAAVNLFYKKVVADELTSPYFVDLDMESQTRKQVAFLAWAFGAPSEYRGRDLRSSHAELVRDRGLSDVHFDAVAKHLADTLRELGIHEPLVSEVMSQVAPLRDVVLGR